MKQSRWNKIESILDTALTLSGDKRTTYISEACGTDKGLLNEVYEILAAMAESEQTQFLESASRENDALLKEVAEKPVPDTADDLIGTTIGSFTLIKKIGSGGMGAVYKAERSDGQFAHQVAIKLLQKGIQSEETLRRFRMEQEILASLKHPNIAQLYDGGVTDGGLPFLVMEYVNGVPIDQYCDNHALTIEERITLFKNVCKAVQFAHANLVIHRDLKAQNIYVTAEGNVKVLDFGIAKLLDPKLTEQTLLQTRPGQKFWTPQYASPEQVKGEAVTTATDVYALGVLLQKLLAGTYPLDLKGKPIAEVEQIIADKAPVVMSGSVDEAELKKELTGDLDALVLKALRKEPAYRYNSVGQLLEELERYRNGLPLVARKDTAPYRIGKFFRRHKAGIAITGIILLVISGLIGFYTWRISQERDEAKIQSEKTDQVKYFVFSMFEVNDPSLSKGKEITARELLDRGTERIDKELSKQPVIQAEIYHVVGTLYKKLGVSKKANKSFQRAVNLQRDELKPTDPIIAASLNEWGFVLLEMDKADSAESILRESLKIWEANPDDPLGRSSALSQLGMLMSYQGHYEEAEQMLRESLKLKQQNLPPDDPAFATTLSNLGLTLKWSGDLEAAEPLYRRALKIKRKELGNNDPNTAITLDNLGVLLGQRGDYEESEASFLEALKIRRETLGANHPDVALTLNNLATLYRVQGRLDKAEPMYNNVLEMNERIWGRDHRRVATNLVNLGSILQQRSDYDKALRYFNRALAIRRKSLGNKHVEVAKTLDLIVDVFIAQKKYKLANTLSSEALKIANSAVDDKSHNRFSILRNRGEVLIGLGKLNEAEPLIRESLNLSQEVLSPDHPQTAKTSIVLGDLLFEKGEQVEAEKLLLSGYEILKEKSGPDSPNLKRAIQLLVDLYTSWGKPDKAAFYKAQSV